MWQCHLSAQDYRYYPVDGYSLLKRLPLHPLTGPRCPAQTVGQWLENIGLPQYENHLMANGFDNVQFMVRNLLYIAVYRPCSCFFVCLFCDLK
uniref:SAM domain-containing protein n=1 Tax=Crocodylus porosus TaxID=8502 RepID=A0A7M4FN36_CROPO